ncbi:hypothetical protein V2I01_13400 [Micromonospora sp. BRA006-A]|nr:hypothetical protein [Micromonospora sp. BRA006-A]
MRPDPTVDPVFSDDDGPADPAYPGKAVTDPASPPSPASRRW